MRLIVDTNMFFAGILKDSTAREIILFNNFKFYSPDYLLIEYKKYKGYLLKKSKLDKKGFEELYSDLIAKVQLVTFDKMKPHYLNVLEVMNSIDPNDTPFIAAGIALNCDGIWTNDDALKQQDLLKVIGTGTLKELVEFHKKNNK